MNASIPLPLLLITNSLTLEDQLYEIITERSKACAVFLRNSFRSLRAMNMTVDWAGGMENFDGNDTTTYYRA